MSEISSYLHLCMEDSVPLETFRPWDMMGNNCGLSHMHEKISLSLNTWKEKKGGKPVEKNETALITNFSSLALPSLSLLSLCYSASHMIHAYILSFCRVRRLVTPINSKAQRIEKLSGQTDLINLPDARACRPKAEIAISVIQLVCV